MKWLWPALLAPVGVGLLVSLMSESDLIANPRVAVSARLDEWSLLLGILFSALLAAGWGLVAWRERTSRRSLAAQRKSQAEEHRRFLQRFDHELKNPLTAIRAGLANLGAALPDANAAGTLEGIDAQAVRLGRLIADLRKIGELESRPLELEAVDVDQLLKEVVGMAQEHMHAGRKPIVLIIPQAPRPLPAVRADRDLLHLALFNLLDNAIKYTQAQDRIEVRARRERADLVIEVADTGPGMHPDEQTQVWEDLYRGAGARGIEGSGLGLALVRAIIRRHRGRAELDSRLGEGTLVTVRLPVA